MQNDLLHAEEEKLANSSNNEIHQFLTFFLDDEEYGVDIMQVMEIRSWSETTRLPNTPEFVLGIINLRGVVVPVLDIRRRFGMEPAELTGKSVVIILSSTERTLGILVDNVSDILEVRTNNIKSPPPMSNAIEDEFLHGLVSLDKHMVVLLSTEKLFSERLLQQIQHHGENKEHHSTNH